MCMLFLEEKNSFHISTVAHPSKFLNSVSEINRISSRASLRLMFDFSTFLLDSLDLG